MDSDTYVGLNGSPVPAPRRRAVSRSRRLLIGAGVILALAAVSVGWRIRHQTAYTAENRILIGTLDPTAAHVAGYGQARQTLASTYSRMVEAPQFRCAVAAALDVACHGRFDLLATPVPDAPFLVVRARSKDPALAVRAVTIASHDLARDVAELESANDWSALHAQYLDLLGKSRGSEAATFADYRILGRLQSLDAKDQQLVQQMYTVIGHDAATEDAFNLQLNALQALYVLRTPGVTRGALINEPGSGRLIRNDATSSTELAVTLSLAVAVVLLVAWWTLAGPTSTGPKRHTTPESSGAAEA